MLIAEDARKDSKDLLNEMNASRKKEAAQREAIAQMKKQADSLKKRLQTAYKKELLPFTIQLSEKQDKLKQISATEKETAN
ncbi:MAG: hypothetical protein ABIP79_16685 [Chitinophagaceae bacterium]